MVTNFLLRNVPNLGLISLTVFEIFKIESIIFFAAPYIMKQRAM